jgi:hypothetical protein
MVCRLLLVLIIFLSQSAWAMPKHFEVWFLSIDRAAFLDQLLYKTRYSKMTAQSGLQCQPMGEYCFDPQVGLYKRGQEGEIQEELDYAVAEDMEEYNDLPTASSVDRNMIECEEGMLFDMFCGKAKAEKKSKVKLEVWFDVSSTMKQVDPTPTKDICKRQSFISAVDIKCPMGQKMNVHIFTETKKETDTFERVCLSYGLNEIGRLMKQIEESKVDNLIIVTDIFEASERFVSFIENSGVGTHRGVDEPFYAKDMKKLQQKVISYCQ